MTVLHAGGKFDKDSYKVSGGLHGVGVSCVNALSTKMITTVHREGKVFEQEYHIGIPQYTVREIGVSDKTGTHQHFWPDDSIFTVTEYKFDILKGRLRELSYLNRGIRISLTDLREKNDNGEVLSEVFYSEGGITEFVEMLDQAAGRKALIPSVITVEGHDAGTNVAVDVALTYNDSYSEHIYSYVNNINTIEGGTHVTGFRQALTRVFKTYGDKNGCLREQKLALKGMIFAKV
nr:hypothetical protein [Niabella hibiscisoli]